MMFSVCLSSFLFILTSSLFGMPISGTHTVVGALLGAGLVITGVDGLNWNQMLKIVASWFISPAMAGILSFGTMMLVLSLTFNTKSVSFQMRLLMQKLITAVCFMIIGFIMDDLLQDTERDYLLIALTASPAAGIILYRLVLLARIS